MFSSKFAARCAAAVRAQSQQVRKFGSDHHGPDTAYDPALNQKFNLPPIPKDGVFRRSRIDMNAYGPWSRNADVYMRDPTDLVPFFDRNGPLNITPQTGAVHFAMFFSGLLSIYMAPRFILGEDASPNFTPGNATTHPGPLPQLVSTPNANPRKLVAEFV